MLVGLGSALIMVVSIYGFDKVVFPDRDPARLAAQVVSGIGFLGAVQLFKLYRYQRSYHCDNLWIVMAVGLAAGAGQFVIAGLGTLFSLIVLIGLRRLEHLAKRAPKLLLLFVIQVF